jgi:membrane protein DedA with SNARE-associated domain
VPQQLQSLATSPWLLVVVFAVAGLDAVLPFMPSESTVVAVGVLTASTGRPHLALLILVAAAGAYLGDRLAYQIGRGNHRVVIDRLQRGRRSQRVHRWVHRLLHDRGALVVICARYLPGGRSATAFAAGVVGYPLGRFRIYTAVAVLIWAVEAALLGYLGGAAFAGRPLLGLAVGWTGALLVTGCAVLVRRVVSSGPSRPRSRAVRGRPDRAASSRPTAP